MSETQASAQPSIKQLSPTIQKMVMVRFVALLLAQIGLFPNLWRQHLVSKVPDVLVDAIIVPVLTALLLIGYLNV
tara:strand:+ start:542 stop:766 length:225 start_codon:yes stop_codon:yes gene_type:complete